MRRFLGSRNVILCRHFSKENMLTHEPHELVSLPVLIPNAQTISFSLQKEPTYVKRQVVASPVCHINQRSLAGNVTWRPRNRGHRAFSLFRRDRFRCPPPPRRSATKLESKRCRVVFQVLLSSPKPAFRGYCFFVLPRRINIEPALSNPSQQEGMH